MTTGPAQPPRPSRNSPIKLDMPATLLAHYSNFAMITYSLSEVILDFAQMLPNMPQGRVLSRIILTPTNAKLLYKALGDSIAKYEDVNGEIKVPPTLADHLFSGVRVTSPVHNPEPPTEAEDKPTDE